jgi:hypothetical protein
MLFLQVMFPEIIRSEASSSQLYFQAHK